MRGGTGTVLASASSLSYYASSAAGGDLDDDGIQDLAIGYPEHNSNKGTVLIDFGPVAGSISGVGVAGTSSEGVGTSLAIADLNDGGIDDLVIGGTGDDESATDTGAVWVFVGGGDVGPAPGTPPEIDTWGPGDVKDSGPAQSSCPSARGPTMQVLYSFMAGASVELRSYQDARCAPGGAPAAPSTRRGCRYGAGMWLCCGYLVLLAPLSCRGRQPDGPLMQDISFSEMVLHADGTWDDAPVTRFDVWYSASNPTLGPDVTLDGVPMYRNGNGYRGFESWRLDGALPAGVHVVSVGSGSGSVQFVANILPSARHLLPASPLGTLVRGGVVVLPLSDDPSASGDPPKATLALAGADLETPRIKLLTSHPKGELDITIPAEISPGAYVLQVAARRFGPATCPAETCLVDVRATLVRPITVE